MMAQITVCELYKEHNKNKKRNVPKSTQKGRYQLMKVLQYIMGHENFTTTWEHYAHGSAELAKEEYRLLGI